MPRVLRAPCLGKSRRTTRDDRAGATPSWPGGSSAKSTVGLRPAFPGNVRDTDESSWGALVAGGSRRGQASVRQPQLLVLGSGRIVAPPRRH